MFKPLALFIGLRYTRAKRRNHFISFISLSSIAGLALGVTALITVLSVMNGFEQTLRNRILGMTAQATVVERGRSVHDWKMLVNILKDKPHVLAVAPFIRGEVMLTRSGNVNGVVLQGIVPESERNVSDVGKKMVEGSLKNLKPGAFGIVLGKDLAASLGVGLGDKVTVVAPETTVTPAGILPRLKQFKVVGIFRIGMYEYDSALALVNMQDAAKLFRMGKSVSGLRLRLDNLYQAPAISRQLTRDLPPDYAVIDWTQYHANFFKALKTEKTVMFVILTLIVAVAAFNIVSALVMVVTDKESDVAILRTLGMSPRGIMAIFIVQGTVIGLVGTLIGMLGGIWLASNVETIVPAIEHLFHVQFLSPEVYYISELPSQMKWSDVVHVSTVAFVLCLLATIYPAWRASRTQPAEALRYE